MQVLHNLPLQSLGVHCSILVLNIPRDSECLISSGKIPHISGALKVTVFSVPYLVLFAFLVIPLLFLMSNEYFFQRKSIA